MKRTIANNTHPGEILREEVIKANRITVAKASELLKTPTPTLSKILNGKRAITADFAIRIAKVFGGKAHLWVRLQASYNLRKAEVQFDNSIDLKKFSNKN